MVWLSRFGEPDALVPSLTPDWEPGGGQVLTDVTVRERHLRRDPEYDVTDPVRPRTTHRWCPATGAQG